jgi:glycosyltransferase involved in cell wall biosynthesis
VAKNIGAKLAVGDYVLFCDIDHVIFADFNVLFDTVKGMNGDTAIKFQRQGNTVHPGIFLVDKDYFLSQGGWPEDFSGNYGHDNTYIKRYFKITQIAPLSSGWAHTAIKSSTHNLMRDPAVNKEKLNIKEVIEVE